jgi:CSLREA domain-containing protein
VVAFNALNIPVNETDGTATLTVILSAASTQLIRVGYATSNDTATAGNDYTATNGTLTFLPGQTVQTITVPIIDDPFDEQSLETFVVTLSNAINATLGLPNPALVTIMDDEFVVTSTDDVDDGACNNAHCSLREAIDAVNAYPGPNLIQFNITGLGPHTIIPGGLPIITDPVIIDGTTQPGASCAAWPPTLLIVLSGNNAIATGLRITAGGSTVRGLVIGSFTNSGIELTTNGSNHIVCNYIGVDNTGLAAMPNTNAGIYIDGSSANIIGGAAPNMRNLISGNGVGVSIANATGNQVFGNYIGTNLNGSISLGNTEGVSIFNSANNFIGSDLPGTGNLISGNTRGVYINGAGASGNQVQGNFIGTNPAGNAGIGNIDGVAIWDAPNNIIGGTSPAARNLISGNGGDGIDINGAGATGNLVQGNYIGTDVTGAVALSNGDGIVITNASDNTIGGITAGLSGNNTIAHNINNGVAVISTLVAVNNRVLNNNIFSNNNLGINLIGLAGVDPNDGPGDPDGGANNLQNYPVLSSAVSGGAVITITGVLTSTPNIPFHLEFFDNALCDPSGYGEGEIFLGSVVEATNGAGTVAFNTILAAVVPSGHAVTATATDPGGNTSEFSACVTVP